MYFLRTYSEYLAKMSVTESKVLNLDIFYSKGGQNFYAFPETYTLSSWVKDVREYRNWESSSSFFFSSFLRLSREARPFCSASCLVPTLNDFLSLSKCILGSLTIHFLYWVKIFLQIRHLHCNQSGNDAVIPLESSSENCTVFELSWT